MGSYEEEWSNMHAAELRLDMEPCRLTVGGQEIVADLRAVVHLGEDARVEDPVGIGEEQLGDAVALWESAHTESRRVTLGSNRVIVCGMEALAHTMAFEELAGCAPRTWANTEIFGFDAKGHITSWRVFRDEAGI